MPGAGELVDLDEDDGELPPELEDPGRPFRRLIQAILLASIEDFTESQDRQTHNEARAFLFPESTAKKAHLARLVECSGLDAGWFRDRCERLRLRVVAPEGQTASASRYAVKRRARCPQVYSTSDGGVHSPPVDELSVVSDRNHPLPVLRDYDTKNMKEGC